jgi:hypothetical protein
MMCEDDFEVFGTLKHTDTVIDPLAEVGVIFEPRATHGMKTKYILLSN